MSEPINKKPNPIHYVTDNYSRLDYLNSNNAQLAKIAGLGLALILGIVGSAALIAGHRILPQLFLSLREQYLFGGEALLASASFAIIALLIPKIVTEIKERKVRNFLLKNYVLVGTNLDTKNKNLKKLLKEAKIIALTERHRSIEMKQKNKFVIEHLWNYSSLLLSEREVTSSDMLLAALDAYKLEIQKIHRGACWDINDEIISKHFQKLEILAGWGKHLVQLKEDILNDKKFGDIDTYFKSNHLTICSELNDLRQSLEKVLIENKKEISLCKLFHAWCTLGKTFRNNINQWIEEKHIPRQNSLSNHMIYYAKNNRVFVIAGSAHLTVQKDQIWEPEELIDQDLKKGKIPYIILHAPGDQVENQTRFWQDYKVEGFKEIILPYHEIEDFAEAKQTNAQEKDLIWEQEFKKKLFEFQNWRHDADTSLSDIAAYFDLATNVLDHEFFVFKKKFGIA